MKKYIIFVLSIFLLSGCSGHASPNAYRSNYANVQEKVVEAVIVSMIPTKVDNSIAGNYVENSSIFNGSSVNVTGATIVDGLKKEPTDTNQEIKYTLRKKDGSLTSVVQTNEFGLRVGGHVLVVYSDTIHLIPDTRLKS